MASVRKLELPPYLRWKYERHGVPQGRHPLFDLRFTEALSLGLDAMPGQLVENENGRWGMIVVDPPRACA